MSIVLLVVAVLSVLLSVIAALGGFLVLRGDSNSKNIEEVESGPTARDVLFLFRFQEQNAEDMLALVKKLAPRSSKINVAEARKAARELIGSMSEATHAYVGTAHWPPTEAYCSVSGGVIIGLRIRTRVDLCPVFLTETEELVDLVETLGAIVALPDEDIIDGVFQHTQPTNQGNWPRLIAMPNSVLPRQRPCVYCKKPLPVFATICEFCAARG